MAMYEEEKQSYIDKLGRQIMTLGQILGVESCGLITAEVRGRLEELKRKAENYKRKLEKNEFEIAIVGLEKAGKSTFANALMGNDILPSKEERCTYTSTRICSSDDGKDTAVVEFFSRKEFNERFKGQLSQMGIEMKEDDSFDKMTLGQYTKMFDNLDAEKKKIYGNNVNQDVEDSLRNKDNLSMFIGRDDRIFSGKTELASKELKQFIENPAYALAVKNISIMSTQLSGMPNAVIYDVPGFDSPTQIHREQTVREMRKVDAIILVASADKPSFTAPSVDLFQNNTDDYGLKFEDKIFVFANKADRAIELPKNMDKIRSELQRYGIMSNPNPERLVSGSAFAALYNDEQAKAKLKSFGIENGIAKIKKRLEDYNKTERFAVLKVRIEKIQDELCEEIKNLENELGGDEDSVGFIAQGYSKIALELFGKKEGIKERLIVFFNEVKNTEISPEVKEKVVNQISVDNGSGVTDGEYDKAKDWVSSKYVSCNESPEEVETKLRGDKRDVLYNKYTEGIIGLSNEKHQAVDAGIVDIFMEELDIAKSNSNYDVLRGNIIQFIDGQKFTSDETGYYRSLIERFSVDLFEAMLNSRLGSSDRWNKYKSVEATFKTLELFDENKEKDEYAVSICDLVLYQKRIGSETEKETDHSNLNENGRRILDAIKVASNFVPGGNIVKLILNVQEDAEKVSKMLNSLSGKKGVAESNIENALSKLSSMGKTENEEKLVATGENSNDRYSEKFYSNYFAGKSNKDKETIIKDINTDIQNLHDVLDSAVIKAIDIEKAFSSLQKVNKDRIIKAMDGKPYEEFIQKNQGLICSSEYQNLEIEQQRRMTKKAVLGNIKRLYEELAQSGTGVEA